MIRIGTRKSRLALVQAELVKEKILEAFPQEEVEFVPIVTKGDRELEKSLASFGGKGIFTQEIERALLDGDIDMAVHSAKDVPMELAEGLVIGAALAREDTRDVLVTMREKSGIKVGSVVGTSSLRRELQIKKMIPGVEIKVLRGNVPTRIEKLRRGEYDGILLAAAGLKRLGLEKESDLQYEYLDEEIFLPAAGQGILAVELRENSFCEVMEYLNDEETMRALMAERLFLDRIGGSCNAPCAVLYREKNLMQGMYAKDGVNPRYASVLAQGSDEDSIKKAVDRLVEKLNIGFVYLVGAGPGCYEGITVRGLNLVRRAQVIIYDNLISPSILNQADFTAELIYVGKRAGKHAMPQERISGLLIQKAKEGKHVVRLKGGDPFIFGRGGEECQALQRENIPFEVVSGVSSFYSVPAAAGIAVTHRNTASSLHVITGHEGKDKTGSEVDYEVLAREEGTLIFLMGLKSIRDIAGSLIRAGKAPDTKTAVISRGFTARQKLVVGRLDAIAGLVEKEQLKTPAVIIVGEVASAKIGMDFNESLPLSGRRILFTGTRNMAGKLEEAFSPLGAERIAISLLEVWETGETDADEFLKRTGDYAWIVFASAAGVHAFFRRLLQLRIDRRCLSGVKFAVVGSSTEDTLKEYGYFADFLPSRFTSRCLAEEWVPLLDGKEQILVIRGLQGADYLERALEHRESSYDCAILYKTVQDDRRGEELRRVLPDVDYVIITSGSGARAFADLCREEKAGLDKVVIAAIGPETAKACEKAGIPAEIVAERHDAGGLAKAVLQYEEERIPR